MFLEFLLKKKELKSFKMTSEEWGDAMSIIADGLSAVTEGCRLPVRMNTAGSPEKFLQNDSEEWPKAEVLSIRNLDGINQYYVHFVDFNKRLDEWVTEDRLDTRRIEPPTLKDDKTTGISTPLRRTVSMSTSAVTSRPPSPGPATPLAETLVTGAKSKVFYKFIRSNSNSCLSISRDDSISCSITKEKCS